MESEKRKSWEKEQKKKRIIDIAEKIFFENGYDGTTINDIAREAGYHKRTIYLYFRDKEELFLAVVLRAWEIFYRAMKDAFENSEKGIISLKEMGNVYFNFFMEYPEYFNMLMVYEARIHEYYTWHEDTNADEDETDFRAACHRISNESGQLVTEAIRKNIEQKNISTSLEPQQLMLMLWGQVFGIMNIILMRQPHFKDAFGITYEEFFNHFISMIEKSLHQ